MTSINLLEICEISGQGFKVHLQYHEISIEYDGGLFIFRLQHPGLLTVTSLRASDDEG
jgi:hypothetical protein